MNLCVTPYSYLKFNRNEIFTADNSCIKAEMEMWCIRSHNSVRVHGKLQIGVVHRSEEFKDFQVTVSDAYLPGGFR